MTEQRTVPLLPAEFVLACVDSAADAAEAAASLRASGVHAEGIQLLRGAEAAERLDVSCPHCTLMVRLLRLIWRFGTTEGLLLGDYQEEAARGHTIVAVHLEDPARLAEVRGILRDHHAHRVEYWDRRSTVTELAA